MRPPLLRRQRTFRLAGLGVVLALLAAARFAPLSAMGPICGFKNATGLPCPLCGGTRAAQSLLEGDFSRAIYLNPLALGAVAILGATAVIFLIEALRGRALADWTAVRRRGLPFIPLALALLLLWWIPHIAGALRTPKTELLDLRNPVARAAYERWAPKK